MSNAARRVTETHLLVETSNKKRKATDDASDIPTKRQTRTSRYEKCITCGQTYDVTANGKRSCQTYIGSVEPDLNDDYFADEDDIYYRDRLDYIKWETDYRFQDNPGAFIWSCCNKHGDEDPCIIGCHRRALTEIKEESTTNESTDDSSEEEDHEDGTDEEYD